MRGIILCRQEESDVFFSSGLSTSHQQEVTHEVHDSDPCRDVDGGIGSAITVRGVLGRSAPRGNSPTTAVLVIETPRQGVTAEQIMGGDSRRDPRDGEPISRREDPGVVFARQWERRNFPGRCEERRGGAGHDGDSTARKGAVDGYRVHPCWAVDAAEGTDEARDTAMKPAPRGGGK